MKALIKLHLKENIKKGSFIIYGILGTLVTLIVLFEMEFSVNGSAATSDYSIYGVQWNILSVIASLAGVAFSMGIISNHRQGTKRELLKLHGLSTRKQYIGLVSGNIIVTTLMALILCTGMFVQIVVKGTEITLIGFIISIIIYLSATMTVTILVSLLTLILPSAPASLLGIFITLIGSARGTLQLSVGNSGGIFGKVIGGMLNLVPPLDQFGELTRDFFMSEFSSYNKLFRTSLYLWVLVGLAYLAIKVVARRED